MNTNRRFHFVLVIALFISAMVFGQKSDPVLFTVADMPVHVSEFDYIYSKTNGQKADYSKKSLEEYLDLYVKFKLKVKKAKELRLDTLPHLKKELAGYKKQLADSYLIDKKVTGELVKEAYRHKKEDVDISHILVKVGRNAPVIDTLTALQKIKGIKARIEKGEAFETVAKELSEDGSAKRNGGRIGFVTALFPNGLYELEKAAYAAPIGKLMGPIRTDAGYHLLIVHQRRPAKGQVEVAHILVRKSKTNSFQAAKEKIDSLYNLLQNGAKFEELAKTFSEDKKTAPKGGYLGFFGINRYEKAFEKGAFAVPPGSYSKPVKTSLGWHIIKVLSKKQLGEFEIEQHRIQREIKKDSRFLLARKALVKQILRNNNYKKNDATLKAFAGSLDSTFFTYKWKPANIKEEVLLSFGDDYKKTTKDFAAFLKSSTRKRMRLARQNKNKAINSLFNDFVADVAMRFEEQHLAEKYPEFKALMREYEEGILLFEVTKNEVWDKASKDSTGLKKFFATVEGKYKWDTRAVVSQYKLQKEAKPFLNKVRKYAARKKPDKVLAKFNTKGKKMLSVQEKTFEKGRNKVLDKMEWKVGALSDTEISSRDKSYNFLKIEKILPPSNKTLEEARGYVVADYQDYLEKQWIENLRKEYKVTINNEVLNRLVKN